MLPLLATIGSGLAWMITTIGSLAVWGMGVSLGYWIMTKGTKAVDTYMAARKVANRLNPERKWGGQRSPATS